MSGASELEVRIRAGRRELTLEPASAPESSRGGLAPLLLLHGYGQRREELLPLAYALAASGRKVVVPDLPGHGAHPLPLTLDNARDAAGQAWEALRARHPDAMVAGFSLGARLAMSLPAARAVAISPPLRSGFDPSLRREILRTLRPRRVREERPMAALAMILDALREEPPRAASVALFFARDDLDSVHEAIRAWRGLAWVAGEPVEIAHADHVSILTAPELGARVLEALDR